MVEQVQEWEAQCSRDSENIAMLVDRDDYWLNSEYRSWVSDPDDVDVKAARARAKANPPPEQPILPPVAQRARAVLDRLVVEYIEKVAAHAPKPAEKPSLAELVGQWGLVD